jgi:hypothetical protein
MRNKCHHEKGADRTQVGVPYGDDMDMAEAGAESVISGGHVLPDRILRL